MLREGLEYNATERVPIDPPPGGWHKGLEHRAYHIIRVTRSTHKPAPRCRGDGGCNLMRGRCQQGADVCSSSVISN